MTRKIQFSQVALTAILSLGLLLTACGGSSNKDKSEGGSSAKGEAVDYTGNKSAAVGLPETEEGQRALAEAIVQVLKVKNIPLYRADEFGNWLIADEVSCETGSTDYKAVTEQEYDEEYDETFEQVISADVTFTDCVVKVDEKFNGELHYTRSETETSSTDTYRFKNLSIEDNSDLYNNKYLYTGEYLVAYKLQEDGNIGATQNWNFAITYTDPSGEVNFTTKGKQTYVADFEEDELKSAATYTGSFTLGEKTYLFKYEDSDPYSYDNTYSMVKFYDPELGYYNIGLTGIESGICTKDSKMYSSIAGEILLKDSSDASLLAITPSCEGIDFQ